MRSRRRFLFGAALVGGAYIAYTVYRQQRQLQELFSELFGVATVDASEEARAREHFAETQRCLLYTSPSPRDRTRSRMPSSA